MTFIPATRTGMMAFAAIVGSLAVALGVAFLYFGMSGQDIGLIAVYLALSGSISLATRI